MGEASTGGSLAGELIRQEGMQGNRSENATPSRGREVEDRGKRAECGEPAVKKGALAVGRRHYKAKEKTLILGTIERTQKNTKEPIRQVLSQIGISPATYYRWKARSLKGQLEDLSVQGRKKCILPTPKEVQSVCAFALKHPAMGYKRLTWMMVDLDVAYLRPYQVYGILKGSDLIMRRSPMAREALRRPPEPDHPDQVWHVDIMYLYIPIPPRWYYLVDVLDGYSRFLVNWSLNLTLEAYTVTLTIQQALTGLKGRHPEEPRLVHDHGPQFLSSEWRSFISGIGLIDIKTRLAHPESNGRLERLHRTHREEGLAKEINGYYQALDALTQWSWYYNHERPHSALGYMPPIEYYRGDPGARWANRYRKISEAACKRKVYWGEHIYGEVGASQK